MNGRRRGEPFRSALLPRVAFRSPRSVFTRTDKEILKEWVLRNGGRYSSFKNLARLHPQHPSESWRNHYRRVMKPEIEDEFQRRQHARFIETLPLGRQPTISGLLEDDAPGSPAVEHLETGRDRHAQDRPIAPTPSDPDDSVANVEPASTERAEREQRGQATRDESREPERSRRSTPRPDAWTKEEDQILLGDDRDAVIRMAIKHGRRNTLARLKQLEDIVLRSLRSPN